MDKCFWRKADGFTRGIWFLWNSSVFQVNIMKDHEQFIHASFKIYNSLESSFITDIYASPLVQRHQEQWEKLVRISMTMVQPQGILGDFNAYLYVNEKLGGAKPNVRSMLGFKECLRKCELMDIGF